MHGLCATERCEEIRGIFNGGAPPLFTSTHHWQSWVVMICGSGRACFQTYLPNFNGFLLIFHFVRDFLWSYTWFHPLPNRLKLAVNTRSCCTLQVANGPCSAIDRKQADITGWLRATRNMAHIIDVMIFLGFVLKMMSLWRGVRLMLLLIWQSLTNYVLRLMFSCSICLNVLVIVPSDPFGDTIISVHVLSLYIPSNL